jgi:hypothetical protein
MRSHLRSVAFAVLTTLTITGALAAPAAAAGTAVDDAPHQVLD